MVSEAMARLAAQEAAFFSSEFLSPVLNNRLIKVKIAGIILHFRITKPKHFEGWGVFKPQTTKTCVFIRSPSLAERQAYLTLFPVLRLVLCGKTNGIWHGTPAHLADTRFKVTGLVPVALPEEVQIFQTVRCRFDGESVWFDSIDRKQDPKRALYLRDCLTKLVAPEELAISGLTQEERDAYLLAYGPALEVDIENRRDKNEDRLKEALRRAGASYQSYLERGDSYTISFSVNGETHKSTVKKSDLSVESAGICLSGTDKVHDLQSLVSVMKEGQRRHKIVRVGDNQNNTTYEEYEDDY